jgi:helix-turn-helix protein
VALKIQRFNVGQFTADEPQSGIGLNRPELSFGFGGAMSKANPDDLGRHERLEKKQETALDGRTPETPERSKLLACLLIMPSDAEPIVALLEQLVASSQTPIAFPSLLEREPNGAARTGDHWLEHADAAICLGISKSTLYRYICQQRIECRKIAGRLEYRQSALERLKKEQIRPARLSHHAGGIIPAALSSGK